MRIAVCDDEVLFLEKIKQYMEKNYRNLDTEIDYFVSAEELLFQAKKGRKYHLGILDIEMEKMDGMTLARQLKELDEDMEIIFLTSHRELALEGYEVKALRFLVKPIQEEKLAEAIFSAKKILEKRYQKLLFVQENTEEIYLKPEEIYFIEAADKQIKIVTKDREIMGKMGIAQAEKLLPGELFFRCHRSFLVNLSHIRSIDGERILCSDGKEAYVSRLRKKELKAAMELYIRENAW